MGLLSKIKGKLLYNWCDICSIEMTQLGTKQLYALPEILVGHYVDHTEPEWYKKHMHPVTSRSQIPAGMYACSLYSLQCPSCYKKITVLTTFLPVRDINKTEEVHIYKNKEFDDILSGL